MLVALASSGYELLFATWFLGMGDIVTKDARLVIIQRPQDGEGFESSHSAPG